MLKYTEKQKPTTTTVNCYARFTNCRHFKKRRIKMCVAAVKTATAMMEGIEPTLVSILAATKLTNTPAGIAVITAYNAALAALQNWKSGTVAQNIIQLLTDFQGAVQLLPIPAAGSEEHTSE